MRLFLAFFLSIFLLQGCFIANEFFVEPEAGSESPITLQTRTEDQIKQLLGSDSLISNYTPYGFSAVKIIKPYEIDSLEKLQLIQPKNAVDSSQIKSLTQYIRDNDIRKSVKTTHFFTYAPSDSTTELIEIDFTLNDTLGIIDQNLQIDLIISNEAAKIFPDYFYERTIFKAPTYTEARDLSKTLYNFFKEELESLNSIDEKSEFLENTLKICSSVKTLGEFKQDYFLGKLSLDYIEEEHPEIKSYQPLQFSDLYELVDKDDNSKLGYYYIHEFSGMYNETMDTNVVLIEFTPYFMIDDIYQLEEPFDNYILELDDSTATDINN